MPYRTCAPNPCSLLFFLRTSRGLTQTKLSRLCHVNINSICQCELRGTPMTLANLRRLAEFFHVPMDALARNDFSVVADMPPVEQRRTDAFRNHLRKNRTRMEVIGNLGEDFVAAQEREKLKGTPYADRINTGLADDKKGVCDMMSFDPATGTPIFIEVKATDKGEDKELNFSREELEFLKHCASSGIPYELHRVYHVGTDKIAQTVYTAQEVLDTFDFLPTTYVTCKKGGEQA